MTHEQLLGFLLTVTTGLSTIAAILIITISCQVFVSIPYYKNTRDNSEIEKLLLEAVSFYSSKLDIKNDPTINVTFEFPKMYTFFYGITGKNKKEENTYEIIIMMNHNKYELISTLAHEMVHVKQMANGELEIDQETEKKYWKGVDHTHTYYDNQPWEIEAFKKENKLANDFMRHKGMTFGPLLLKISNYWLSI